MLRRRYTEKSIQSAWRTSGIFPNHPNAVLTKFPGTQLWVPKTSSVTRGSFKFLQTPRNQRQLFQQTLSAIKHLEAIYIGSSSDSSISLLRRLAHQSECALHVLK